MDRQRWQRIRDLFETVRSAPTEERARLLAASGDDADVQEEVTRLVSTHDRLKGFLGQPAGGGSAAPVLLANRYRLERQLGLGGFGVVWLARDEDLHGRHVVVKLLRQDVPQDAGQERQVKREIEALARLNHIGVVGVLDKGVTAGGQPFLVLDYIPGETLSERLKRGRMEVGETERLLGQLGEALQAAHDSEIIHRDLKPGNIMLRQEKEGARAVVIDFGVAALQQGGRPTATTSVAVGTPSYMAPEQFTGRCSTASDVYALALITFEMLTGRRMSELVGEGEQPATVVRRLLARLRPELPRTAGDVLARALAIQPGDRYRRIDEFSAALIGSLRRQKTPWQRFAVVAAALLIVALTGGLFWRGLPQPNAKPAPPPDRDVAAMTAARRGETGTAARVGVTLWQLRASQPTDHPSVRMLLHEEAGDRELTPVRISTSGALREGERLRLGIESSQPGYLYVVTRERYANGWGKPWLVFPTLRIRQGNNRVEPGRVVEIPDRGDEPPFLTLTRSRPDHAEEMLTLLVAPEPLPGLQARSKPQELPGAMLEDWQSRWGARLRVAEGPVAIRQAQTSRERDAADGGTLGPDEPVPQTIFEPGATEHAPLLVTFPLRFAPRAVGTELVRE